MISIAISWLSPFRIILVLVLLFSNLFATIDEAEYFINDADLGPGMNTSIPVSVTDGIASTTATDISIGALETGMHVAYIRFHDDSIGWTSARGIPFLVNDPEILNTITEAEYYIDTDPGIGNAIPIDISSSANQVNFEQSVDLTDQLPGLHGISLRLFSPETGWGSPRSALFRVTTESLVHYIQSAQYFIGDVPETSNITTVTSPADGSFDGLNEALELLNIELPATVLGSKKVGVRFQMDNGRWSPWRTTQITVVEETETFTIAAAEYFIDDDPGKGSGIAILQPLDGTYDELEEEFDLPVSIEGLSLGGHFIYLRLQRNDGSWGAARGSYFIVSEDAQPTIAAAEYYVNPSTTAGSGIAFSPLDGAFNTTEESVSAIANMASLNAQEIGNYSLFVRYMNSRGEWGPVSSQSFSIETRPQLSVNLDTLDFGALFTGETRKLNLVVSNIGDADLIISSVSFSDDAYSTDWSGATLTPLSSANFDVTFAPIDPEGNHHAFMTLTNNDADEQITLLGVGLDTAPIMAIAPDSLDFGTVQTIASATLSVRVSNHGNENLILSGATSTNTAFSTSIANPTVVPDEYVDIDITFAPALGMSYADTVYIISNDTYFPSFPIYVSGVGSVVPVPDIQASLESLIFGNIAIENAPKELTFIINNVGTKALNITDININESAFTSSPTGSQTINAAGSLPMTVTFSPTQSQRYSGEMIITNDDPDTPELTIRLDGSSVFPEMVLSANTFNFGDVGVTASSTQALIITNLGSDTLKIASFLMSSSIDSVVEISPATFNINPTGGQRAFTLSFNPAEPVAYVGTIVISSNTDNDTLYISGTGLDDEPPEIVFNPEELEDVGTSENTAISISAPITDNNQLAWVRLYFRQGGKTSYDSTEMEIANGVFHGDIPPAYVRNRGVEYFIKAYDGANAQVIPATAPEVPAIIRVTLPSLPPITFSAKEYGMISVPSDLHVKNVRTILEDDISAYDINSWRLFRWINGNYVELSENDNFTFEPGNAYWLITGDRQVITLDSSTSVKTNEDYLISLDQGWNQVGTPYYFPVSWSDVYAASPGVVQGSIAYEWVDNEWQPATLMQPFGGYFISTPSGGSILRIPPRESLNNSAKSTSNPFDLQKHEWLIQVSASHAESQDRFNYIGVMEDAELSDDILDQPKPPAMYPDRIRLYSEHHDWGALNGEYCGDFQNPSSSGNYWDLTLEAGEATGSIRLDLTQTGEIPLGHSISVLNLDLRYALPGNAQHQYSQKVYDSLSKYRIRVLVGDEQFLRDNNDGIGQAPSKFHLSQNFPNPFNGTTNILFDIPVPGALQMVIYDIAGRQIKTLIRSAVHPVGSYKLSWNGNNERGHRVPSGIYLISLQAPNYNMTRKMVLLK